MSDAPETDALVENIGMGCEMVDAWFARKLERERDEAREECAAMQKDAKDYIELADELDAVKRERDEARAEVARLREALQRLADCDWVITPHDRMDAVRKIARDALEAVK